MFNLESARRFQNRFLGNARNSERLIRVSRQEDEDILGLAGIRVSRQEDEDILGLAGNSCDVYVRRRKNGSGESSAAPFVELVSALLCRPNCTPLLPRNAVKLGSSMSKDEEARTANVFSVPATTLIYLVTIHTCGCVLTLSLFS